MEFGQPRNYVEEGKKHRGKSSELFTLVTPVFFFLDGEGRGGHEILPWLGAIWGRKTRDKKSKLNGQGGVKCDSNRQVKSFIRGRGQGYGVDRRKTERERKRKNGRKG